MTSATAEGAYAIRARAPEDDEALLRIERRATELFRQYGYPMLADNPIASLADFRAIMKGHETWTAITGTGDPVGYAIVGPVDGHLHLRELAVEPDRQKQGIGTALVGKVVGAAKQMGFAGVTLTTFRDVPFNAPFYARLEFKELPLEEAGDALRQVFHQEVPKGIDPARRVLMRKML